MMADKRARSEAAPDATTLKVKRLYARVPWEATIELDSSSTLHVLHVQIRRAIRFDIDPQREQGGARQRGHAGGCVPLPARRKLFYLYDFADSWKLLIERTRKAAQVPLTDVQYPRLIGTAGAAPRQY